MRKYNKDICDRQSDGRLLHEKKMGWLGSILQNAVVITRSVKSPDLLTPPKCQSGFKHEWGAVFRKPQAKVKISQFPSWCDKHSTVQAEQPKGFLSAYHSRPQPRPEGSQSRDTRQAFLLSHTGYSFPHPKYTETTGGCCFRLAYRLLANFPTSLGMMPPTHAGLSSFLWKPFSKGLQCYLRQRTLEYCPKWALAHLVCIPLDPIYP